jgi:hypothetical protein
MNSIAAFQMVKALDEERLRYVEKRRGAHKERVASADVDAALAGGQSWKAIIRFPRFTAAASKG